MYGVSNGSNHQLTLLMLMLQFYRSIAADMKRGTYKYYFNYLIGDAPKVDFCRSTSEYPFCKLVLLYEWWQSYI